MHVTLQIRDSRLIHVWRRPSNAARTLSRRLQDASLGFRVSIQRLVRWYSVHVKGGRLLWVRSAKAPSPDEQARFLDSGGPCARSVPSPTSTSIFFLILTCITPTPPSAAGQDVVNKCGRRCDYERQRARDAEQLRWRRLRERGMFCQAGGSAMNDFRRLTECRLKWCYPSDSSMAGRRVVTEGRVWESAVVQRSSFVDARSKVGR